MSERTTRRPRRRSAAAAAGTVAGTVAGIAVAGAMGAAPAGAAPGRHVWDRVAACESSGRWHVNTHNHYYGGLQFWQPTWVEFGGRRYAPRADLATAAQQVEVARRVLAVQGPKAWPVCGKRAKLTKANGHATTASLPAIGPVVRTVPHTPRHTAPPPRHTAPKPHPPASHPPSRPAAPRVERYRVAAGESLSVIAERFGVRGGWQALWAYNRTNVPNPNVVFVGQLLQIP